MPFYFVKPFIFPVSHANIQKNSKGIVFIELSSMELDQNVSSLATLAAHSVGQIRSYALLNSELYI